MAELMTRIILRNDSFGNWEAVKDTVTLLKGEMAIEFNPDATTEGKKTRVKIGDGVHTWSELPYFGGEEAHVYEATVAKGGDHTTAITTALNGAEPNSHDVAIVKEAIIAEDLLSDTVTQKYQHTAYRWNGTSWVAFSGNVSAKNVILDSDFTFTAPVGVITQKNIDDNKGSVVKAAAGKNIQDFFAGIFAQEKNPSRTANASVSWTTEPKGTVEVGTEVTPTYNAKLNAGSYTYGPATGITAKSWVVDIADLTDDNKTANSGTFSKFTAIDGMSGYAKITATATYDDGAIPVTNIGNEYDADGAKNVRIMGGSKSATSAGYTAYRTWFYGYRSGANKLVIADLDSDAIRQDSIAADKRIFTRANGSFTTSMATTDMQQMFFMAPAGKVASVGVAHSVNGAPQTVNKTTVYIKGANNYVTDDAPNGMAYDLFYVSNDNPNSGDATYTITTTKA